MLLKEINQAFKLGTPIIDNLCTKSDEEIINILKSNNIESVNYILESNDVTIKRFDGELSIHMNDGGYPFILVDAVHVYHCTKTSQDQIRYTSNLKEVV